MVRVGHQLCLQALGLLHALLSRLPWHAQLGRTLHIRGRRRDVYEPVLRSVQPATDPGNLSTYAFAIKVNNPGSVGPMKQLIHEPGVTCSQHAKIRTGAATAAAQQRPAWLGRWQRFAHRRAAGLGRHHFARTKYVMSVTVHQLDQGYTTPSFQIQALAAGTTSQWNIIKVYAGDAKPLQKYVVPGGGVRADAIRIEMTGKPPKDNWARLQQVYVLGQDAKGAGVPDQAPYDFWYPFSEHAVIAPGGVYVVCHEGADSQILQSCDQRVAAI